MTLSVVLIDLNKKPISEDAADTTNKMYIHIVPIVSLNNVVRPCYGGIKQFILNNEEKRRFKLLI